MKEVREMKWRELQPIWQQFNERSQTATPFQSYEFLTFTGRGKPYRNDLFRLVGISEWNLVLYSDGVPVVIAPLLIKMKHGRHIVYFRGHFTVANQLDFIYADYTYDEFKFLMDHIKANLKNPEFILDRVSEKTVTCGYLKSYFESGKIEEHTCFSIPISKSYDDWRKTLSRSARQNLSNHYHRLERDKLNWSVCFCYGEKVEACLCKKLMWVYADRFIIKNDCNFGVLTKLATRMLRKYLLRDRMTQWMNSADGNFHAVLYIEKDVAAFASGLCCRDKRIILSRLAINTGYAKYSPGGLLISSVIRHIIAENAKGEMDVSELDLSQGGQEGMCYKQAYGGKPHYNYVFYG